MPTPPPTVQSVDGYQLQDLKCAKCGSVAGSHLQTSCDVCGGRLRGTTPPRDAAAHLGVFSNFARHQGMAALEELAGWVLAQG